MGNNPTGQNFYPETPRFSPDNDKTDVQRKLVSQDYLSGRIAEFAIPLMYTDLSSAGRI
jgi:hypothetical protein